MERYDSPMAYIDELHVIDNFSSKLHWSENACETWVMITRVSDTYIPSPKSVQLIYRVEPIHVPYFYSLLTSRSNCT